MENSNNSRIKVIFLFATILLIALSVMSYARINNLVRATEILNHTQNVKLVLERTVAELIQAETSQRGYLHSKDPVFLKEFYTALSQIEMYRNKIDSLTRNNPTQQQNVASLRMSIDRRLDYMKAVLSAGKYSTVPVERWLGGKALMDEVRLKANKMEQEDEALMKKETSVLNKEAFFTPVFTIFLICCAILTLVVSYHKILLELKISDRLRGNLHEKSLELERSNIELLQKNREARANEEALRNQTAQLVDSNKALTRVNKELELFNYISSHDLQEPLRKIQIFARRINANEFEKLSVKGKDDFNRMQDAASRMQALIEDLLAYSRTTTTERMFVNTNLAEVVADVKASFVEEIQARNATIEVDDMCEANIIPFQFRQLLQNLLSNALKFSDPLKPIHIQVKSKIVAYDQLIKNNATLFNLQAGLPTNGIMPNKQYCHISVCDNGIGFEPQYKDRIFDIFQRLHNNNAYQGTGIGLAIVKKIVENHNGVINASSELNKGACFDIYIPT